METIFDTDPWLKNRKKKPYKSKRTKEQQLQYNKNAVLNRIRRGDLNMENVNDNQRNQRQYHWAKKRGFIDKDMNILED